MRVHDDSDGLELIESAGAWPFITRRAYQLADRSRAVWRSRVHRKRLYRTEPVQPGAGAAAVMRSLWMPRQLNWWIGVVFAGGSSLFMLGSVFTLAPTLAQAWALDAAAINAIFFAGSIPFTTAAYLQLFQAANTGEYKPHDGAATPAVVLFGWRPQDIGWLSCALQFLGTLLFNVNTFDAMLPGLDWLQQDLAIWAPDLAGSVLFLASGYLAFIETCHTYFAWRPGSISWWVTFTNLLGCVAFMISAVLAFVPPRPPDVDLAGFAVMFTLIGAAGFLVGSLLMLPETALPATDDVLEDRA